MTDTRRETMERPKMNQNILQLLREAQKHLDKFNDPTNEGCAVDPAVREAAKLYLESWVAGPLDEAVKQITGEHRSPPLKMWHTYYGYGWPTRRSAT